MAKAKVAPSGGLEEAIGATSDIVSNTVKGTVNVASKSVYGTFYYTSFGVAYLMLAAFSVFTIGENPIGRGIKDGVLAAGKAIGGKRKRK